MIPKRKAEEDDFGSKTSFAGSESSAFSIPDHITKHETFQCRNCKLRERRIRQLERLMATLAGHIDALYSREVRL